MIHRLHPMLPMGCQKHESMSENTQHHLFYFIFSFDVKMSSRFIKQNDRFIAQQYASHSNTLLLAAAQHPSAFTDVFVYSVRELFYNRFQINRRNDTFNTVIRCSRSIKTNIIGHCRRENRRMLGSKGNWLLQS